MSFPANLDRHREAVFDILSEALREGRIRSALKTRGISMEPLIRERDEVVLEARPLDAIVPGALIGFRLLDALVVHRVAAIVEKDGVRLFYEKGDNNMYLTPVVPEAILGVAVAVVTAERRLDLLAPRFRRLGRFVAAWGLVAVKLFGAARAQGRRVFPLGSPASRVARSLLYALLQLPIRVPLAIARRVF